MSGRQLPLKRLSMFFMVLVFLMLILSLIALYQIFEAYSRTKTLDIMSIALSLSAIFLSVYVLSQMRRKPIRLGFEIPNVVTVMECTSCNYRSIRKFQRGDYIFKDVGFCPKCSGRILISSIYREIREKD
ncbi:TPA: hypothetical protein EYP70_02805 [Candidatus Bathyarchaeota archaeon]|nr:hypothetical protein [Candidatus Bathyarchaeota archaeon]